MIETQAISLVVEQISAVTGRAADSIDIDQPFAEMGIESLQAVNIVSNINKHLETPLQATLMFDYPTVRTLAEYIAKPEKFNGTSSVPLSRAPGQSSFELVAIIGMACRFPGAENISEYWNVLKKGIDAISEVPEGRWNPADFKNAPKWGGFIRDIDRFDPDAFSIHEIEAQRMDPQQRWLLMTAWQAIEDAGLTVGSLSGTRTGVFVGISSHDYSILGAREGKAPHVYDATGNAHSVAANRLSYLFNLKGPSLSVDTACSSSLVSIHMACQSLRSGEVDYALAGGVNAILSPSLSEIFAQAQMLSPDGRCKTFSDQANGYVRGEGVGVIVLKRFADALRDGDQIYAVIRGSAVNQDGRTSGLTAPNGPAQEAVIKEALSAAQVRPEEISYIEAHGTGTPLGDPIEYLSLDRVMGERESGSVCFVGSVKTNIGHLEAAAGVAGVIKTALALKNRYLPKSLHFKNINPRIGDQATHLKVCSEGQHWHSQNRRIAGISSFGFGGTNSHVILQEFDQQATLSESPKPPKFLVAISASSLESLRATASDFQEAIRTTADLSLLAESSLQLRLELNERIVVNGHDAKDLIEALEMFKKGQSDPRVCHHRIQRRSQSKIAFLFTGQGSQSAGMGIELYKNFETYRNAFDDCAEVIDRHFPESLTEVILAKTPHLETCLAQTDYGQSALFALEYSLAKLLIIDYGLYPDVVAGHSLGELVAACVAGVIDLPDALQLVISRGKLMQCTAPGSMLVVFEAADKIKSALIKFQVDLAADNAPTISVVSGTSENIKAFTEYLSVEKIRSTPLKVNRAFHSELMNPVLDQFENVASRMNFSAARIPIISGRTGALVLDGHIWTAREWREQLRAPTQFLSMVKTLEKMGQNIFVEIGPHPTLIPMAQSTLPESKATWACTLNRKLNGIDGFYQFLSLLYATGVLKKPKSSRRVQLPQTRFNLRSYWAHATDNILKPQMIQTPIVTPGEAPMSANRESEILADLTTTVSKLLQIDEKEFDVDENLMELGADSLLLLNAVQSIKDKYQVSIPIADAFRELSNLRSIAKFIASNEPKKAPAVSTLPQSFGKLERTPPPIESVPRNGTSGDDIRRLIDQQLEIMARQLQVLGNQGPTSPSGSYLSMSTPPPTPISTTVAEKRGVLGNFQSKISQENMAAEDQKKLRYVEELIQRFNKNTVKTKEHTQKYRMVLADNRNSAGFRPNTKEMIYPIICHKAKGVHFTDFDGHEYLDFTMGFGVNLFGHSPAFIEKAIKAQIELGMCVGPQSFLAGQVAALVSKLTGHERVAFCNSGTEAIMTALRIARTATKRNKVVIFDGSYHGHFDGVLARPNLSQQSIPVAPGVTPGFVDDVIVLEYGTQASLEVIRREAANLAAVLVEPVQSRFPELQPVDFLREVRAITEKSNTAFIWDEVITGFRIRPGGAQEHFGIKADLATYGKILGGGLPIGAIAGSAKFIDPIDGGFWQYGDNSYPKADITFFAGTFSKHPLAMAAAHSVLTELSERGDKLLSDLNERTSKLKKDLNQFFESEGLDLHVNNFGSLFRFKGTGNLDLFFLNLNLRGIYVWEGRNLFLSTNHTDEDILRFKKAVEESTRELIAAGFFKKKGGGKGTTGSKTSFALLAPQKRFQDLALKGSEGESASHICAAVKMKGPLDAGKLKTSIESLLKNFDGARLRLDLAKGEQWFAPEFKFDWREENLRSAKAPWVELNRRLLVEGQKPFELTNESPIRFILYEVVEETWVLALVVHHVAMDGWSLAHLIEETAHVYNAATGGEVYSPKPIMNFEDFLKNPLAFGSEKLRDEAKRFWNERFSKPGPLVKWETGVQSSSVKGQRHAFDLSHALYEKIKATTPKLKVTPMMFMLTAFSKALAQVTGQSEFTVGVPVANRILEGSDQMLGQCVNLAPVKVVGALEKSTQELVKEVKPQMIGAFQNMMHPYQELERAVGGPLFNVIFNLEPASEMPDFGDVSLFLYPFPVTASEFDLMVNVTDVDYLYHVEIDFRVDVLKIEQIRSLQVEFVKTVENWLT